MSGDYLAALAAKQHSPPTGRVHLHLFLKRNGLSRVAVYKDGTSEPRKYRSHGFEAPIRTELAYQVEWRVSTRASSVCRIPGRCVLADIVEAR